MWSRVIHTNEDGDDGDSGNDNDDGGDIYNEDRHDDDIEVGDTNNDVVMKIDLMMVLILMMIVMIKYN